MKAYNLLVAFVAIYVIIQDSTFLQQQSNSVEAKMKRCKIQFRSGEYVVRCPKRIPNKESQRTITRKRGPRGKRGEPGIPGPVGPQGLQGNLGPIGPTGPRGLKGETGPVGGKGDSGPVGPIGPKGTQGDMGPTGAQGPPGLPGNCLSENPVYVQRNGVHCLAGPMGPQGTKGNTGERGIQGPQGIAGKTGRRGEPGIQGPRGSVGLPGLPGTLGKISCSKRYTSWIKQEDMYNVNSISVLCQPAEFMQGFVVDMRQTDIRYIYHCCTFR